MTQVDPKVLEACQKHYTDLFVYQARQRIDSIRFYLIAVAVGANAIVGAGTSNAAKSVIALIAGTITLIFLRLDYRNAQIVEIDEKPLRYLQKQTQLAFSVNDSWVTFGVAEERRGKLASYGDLIPLLYGVIWFSWFTACSFFAWRWSVSMGFPIIFPLALSFALLVFGLVATFAARPGSADEVVRVPA
ncbi:MAG: hypothetical protein ACK4NZ_10360 [Tsuneonella sp.]